MLARIFSRAYAGPRAWLLQRLTAVILASYSVMLAVLLMGQKPTRFESWKAMLNPEWMRITTLLFLFSLFVHAWLGMRDILQDYLPSVTIKYGLEWLLTGVLLLYSAWSVNILWY